MDGAVLCSNQLKIVKDLEMELDKNVPTRELKVLSELSKDIRDTIKKYNGAILNAPELGENCYLVFISDFVIDVKQIDSNLVALCLSDVRSFTKRLLEKI